MLFLEQTQGFAAGAEAAGPQPPSLFELLMQERMAGGFKPAAEYLTHSLTDAYPQLALSLPVRRFEETYALLKLLVERYFLSRYDSLATEKFYGMKRVMLLPAADGAAPGAISTAPLTARARRSALIFAVLVPYLKAKMDNFHKDLKERLPSSPPRQNASAEPTDNQGRWRTFLRRMRQMEVLFTMKRAFVKSYPFAHFAYEGTFFLYQWLYLFGDTPYFSPFLRRMKTILVRVTPEDETAFQQNVTEYRAKALEKLGGVGLFTRLRRLLLRASWATLDHSYALLILGIACYKFLEWMYSEEGVAAKMRMTGTDAPVPPPPLPPQFSGSALAAASLDPSLCPLCKQRRVNPAMSVSGYVFCYTCLFRHIEQHGTCPMTQAKCDTHSIVKIYDDGNL